MKNISNHIFFQIKVKLTTYPKALKVTKCSLVRAYHHFNRHIGTTSTFNEGFEATESKKKCRSESFNRIGG